MVETERERGENTNECNSIPIVVILVVKTV